MIGAMMIAMAIGVRSAPDVGAIASSDGAGVALGEPPAPVVSDALLPDEPGDPDVWADVAEAVGAGLNRPAMAWPSDGAAASTWRSDSACASARGYASVAVLPR
jgi:hypothetical protein